MHVSNGQEVANIVYLGDCKNPKDKTLREQLEKRLEQASDGLINPWHQSNISAGSNVQQEIERALTEADIILVLISPDIDISETMRKVVLERRENNHVRVIPILLRPREWKNNAFGELEPLPKNRTSIGEHPSYKRDKVLQEVAREIMKVVQEISKHTSAVLSDKQNILPPQQKFASTTQPSLSVQKTSMPIAEIDIHPPTGTIRLQIMQMPPVMPPIFSDSIFLANQPLQKKDNFFARESERRALFQRCKAQSATSIIGPRGIGKTWLMKYLLLEAPVLLGAPYRIGYVNAALPRSYTSASSFIIVALECLGMKVTSSQPPLQLSDLLIVFPEAIKQLLARNNNPILCVDEFEELTIQRGFDITFFRMIRAACDEGLSLVTASKVSLRNLSDGLTSSLFNSVQTYPLRPFNEQEAQEFFSKQGEDTGLSLEEQTLLLEASKQQSTQSWPPLALQIAGDLRLQEKMDGYVEDAAYWQGFKERLQTRYYEAGGQK